MQENVYTNFFNEHKDLVEKVKNKAIDDSDMAKVSGGVGGANEATCPKCGQPMEVVNNPYGDNYWHCVACDIDQWLPDADYIEIIKASEAAGQTQGLVYPVWWDKVSK